MDHLELIAQAGQPAPKLKAAGRKTIAKDQLADVFGIELETEVETGNARQRIPAKSPGSKKTAALEKKRTIRADAGSAPEGAPAVISKPAGSRRTTLTAAARKRIAEAQRKRWQNLREKMLARDRSENSPAPAKKSAKTRTAESTSSKPARRLRAV